MSCQSLADGKFDCGLAEVPPDDCAAPLDFNMLHPETNACIGRLEPQDVCICGQPRELDECLN
eukprot:1023122-Pelagomonas_calceolata.AAC.1